MFFTIILKCISKTTKHAKYSEFNLIRAKKGTENFEVASVIIS